MSEQEREKIEADIAAINAGNSPGNIDWNLCAETVNSLHVWINKLNLENQELRTVIEEIVNRLAEHGDLGKIILAGINIPELD